MPGWETETRNVESADPRVPSNFPTCTAEKRSLGLREETATPKPSSLFTPNVYVAAAGNSRYVMTSSAKLAVLGLPSGTPGNESAAAKSSTTTPDGALQF